MHKKERFRTFLVIFILSGLYIFIFSESGILERRELNKKYNHLNEKIDYIKKENENLLKENEKYRAGIYNDKDIIGSGFVYRSGTLVYFKDSGKEIIPESNIGQDDFIISLDHLRIIWIIISMMFLFYYFLKKNKRDDLNDGSDFN